MVWELLAPGHDADNEQNQGCQASSRDELKTKHKCFKRRGLSKFYSSKSQSFGCIELAIDQLRSQFGDSAKCLGKLSSSSSLVSSIIHRNSSDDDTDAGVPPSQASYSGPEAEGSLSSTTDEMCDEFLLALQLGRRSSPASMGSPTRHGSSAVYPPATLARLSRCNIPSLSRLSGGGHQPVGRRSSSSILTAVVEQTASPDNME